MCLLCSFSLLFGGCTVKFHLIEKKPLPSGVYHTVKKGETLWRISKTYGVEISAIKEANGLKTEKIKVGQRLFIPGAKEIKEIPPQPKVIAPGKPAPIIKPPVKKGGVEKPLFSWPMKGKILLSESAIDREKRLAITVKQGDLIKASRPGQVFFLGQTKSYSKTLIIDHLDGYYSIYGGDILFTSYTKGELIGKDAVVGKAYSEKETPVIYFEIRKGTTPVNPLQYLEREK